VPYIFAIVRRAAQEAGTTPEWRQAYPAYDLSLLPIDIDHLADELKFLSYCWMYELVPRKHFLNAIV
jgi:hypothetical protein